ncbi:hypothetical protein B0H17DRAFT_1246630 [Mycena rosella]|uniref:Mid2 domain-containing protein n=1 Tax=Mycena rosella TaxID=1033263 RepID=A0AAD7CZB2_MYCRO|nr:hypothetical protein B0H17DRAFT_1246630 [Mycena rosella]
MSIFALFNLVLYCLFVCATRNITIDDASPLVTYDAPVLQRNITAFDSRLLEDGTITFVAPTPNASPTISIDFTGIAIYIFVAYPGLNESAPSGFTALIDGAEAGGWAAAESALLYRHLVYHSAVLADAPHTLVMQIKPNWELYFDYALYTSTALDPVVSAATSRGASAQQTTGGTTAPDPALSATSGEASTQQTTGGTTAPDPALLATSEGASVQQTTSVTTVTAPYPALSAMSGGVSAQQTTVGTTVTAPYPALSATSGGASAQQTTGGTASGSAIPVTIRTEKPPLGIAIGAAFGGAIFVALGCGGWILLRRRRGPKGFLLRSPPSVRRESKFKSALLDGGAPLASTDDGNPNASEPEPADLVHLTREVRRLTASVQRLESIPEARDGGPALQRPPAYIHGV